MQRGVTQIANSIGTRRHQRAREDPTRPGSGRRSQRPREGNDLFRKAATCWTVAGRYRYNSQMPTCSQSGSKKGARVAIRRQLRGVTRPERPPRRQRRDVTAHGVRRAQMPMSLQPLLDRHDRAVLRVQLTPVPP